MRLVDYPDREMMMMDVADQVAGDIAMALTNHDRASLAVPGGTTPGPIFDTLSGADLHWDRVSVLLTDERRVPPDHPRSNERLLRERLLIDKAAAARYVPIVPFGDMDGLDTAALGLLIEDELPLSVALLGMGADMHTASLFPGSPQLAAALDENAPALMAVEAPGQPEGRVTMTARVLTGAMATHIVITGADKRAALERAQGLNDPLRAPITAVLAEATVHWAE